VVRHIDLDPHRRAAHRLDLGDRAVGGHILGLSLKLLVRVQVEVGDAHLGTEPGEPLCIGPAETSCGAGHNRHLAIQLVHRLLHSATGDRPVPAIRADSRFPAAEPDDDADHRRGPADQRVLTGALRNRL
jgi:hypothetical protein